MSGLEKQMLRQQYFLRRLAGQGGMADVYEAWDQLRSAKVAVKVMRGQGANQTAFTKSFQDEAAILKKLEHPNIVRLYDFDSQNNIVFLVMDWIDGINMRDLVQKKRAPLSVEEVSQILAAISSALNYAHLLGVFHCDVKPHNILKDRNGKVFLTDFGVARHAHETVGGGTPAYMAPEMFTKKNVDRRTDVYSLGITLYEILSGGTLPFRGDSPMSQGSNPRERTAWEHINLEPSPLRAYNRTVPPSVESVIFRAMRKDPQERFSTTLEFYAAFEKARQHPNQARQQQPTVLLRDGRPSTLPPVQSQPPKQTPQPSQPSTPRQAPVLPPRADQNPHANRNGNQVQTSLANNGGVERKPNLIQDSVLFVKGMFGNSPSAESGLRGPRLIGRQGEFTGRIIPVTSQGLTIGRDVNNQIRLYEPSVSRYHAVFHRTWRGIMIEDAKSSVGTFVNNQKLTPGFKVMLRSGDVIRIAHDQIFEFQA